MLVKFAKYSATMLILGLVLSQQQAHSQYPIEVSGYNYQPFVHMAPLHSGDTFVSINMPPQWSGKPHSLSVQGDSGTLVVASIPGKVEAWTLEDSTLLVAVRSSMRLELRSFGMPSLNPMNSQFVDSTMMKVLDVQRAGRLSLVRTSQFLYAIHDERGVLWRVPDIAAMNASMYSESTDSAPVVAYIQRSGVNYNIVFGATNALHKKVRSLQEPVQIFALSASSALMLERRAGFYVATVVTDSTDMQCVVPATLVEFTGKVSSSGPVIAFYGAENDIASLQFATISSELEITSTLSLPDSYTNASRLIAMSNERILIQRGKSALIVVPGEIVAELSDVEMNVESVYDSGSNLYLNGSDAATSYTLHRDAWWQLKLWQDLYAIPLLFVVVLLFALRLWALARKRRNVLRSLYNIDNSDPFVFVDSHLKLEEINPAARHLFGLDASVPVGDMIHVYVPPKQKEVISMIEAVSETASEAQSRLTLDQGDVKVELFVRVFPVTGNFGRPLGVVLIATDITEELAQRQMQNWAQLAHDMQTSLSIIKLNAQQISAKTGQVSLQEKILLQSNVLISRVKDLVTLGRASQDEILDIRDLCRRVASEFDEALFKGVTFTYNLQPCSVAGDKPKLERALRNAIENGIRAMQGHPGNIDLSCRHENSSVVIEVTDNGSGMDPVTQEKMMQPHFSGFQSMGGSGMGTIIMQHVMKLHQGSLHVESEKGKGTTIRFKLPAKQR